MFCNADRHFYSGGTEPGESPMSRMIWQFRRFVSLLGDNHWAERNHFNRRVYRALFAQEVTDGVPQARK